MERKLCCTLLVGLGCLVLFSCDTTTTPSKTVVTAIDTTVKPKNMPHLIVDSLKATNSYRDSDIHIRFGSFLFQKQYTHDDYGYQYRYNDAERGDLFITCEISITAKSKDPTLPIFCAYNFKDGVLTPLGTFAYNFTRWEDYGTYLGNDADFGNDFAHTATIPFKIGLEVGKSDLKSPVYILALKNTCVVRNEDRFQQPAVKYDNGSCVTGGNITSMNELKDFIIVKIIGQSNRNKIAKKGSGHSIIPFGFTVSLPKDGKEPPKKKGYISLTGTNREGHDTVIYVKGDENTIYR